jgi:hypothetical protein
MMVLCQAVTASEAVVVMFPPFPPGGPSPVSEYSKPLQSTPRKITQPPPAMSEFPETVKVEGAADTFKA